MVPFHVVQRHVVEEFDAVFERVASFVSSMASVDSIFGCCIKFSL